jgi:hypothetical protein
VRRRRRLLIMIRGLGGCGDMIRQLSQECKKGTHSLETIAA